MKFKNETEENAKYRLGSIKDGYDWFTIKPGEIKEIPEHIGDALKLTKIEKIIEGEDDIVEEQAEEDSEDVDEGQIQQDTKVIEKEYQKKLISIKGVGKKSAEDIIKKYPTEEKLIEAIKNEEEIHNYDNVDAAVKDAFEDEDLVC